MKETRVVVTGGRNYGVLPEERELIHSVFYRIQKKYGRENLTLICGMASGADTEAYCYCKLRWNWNCEEYRADWKTYGRRAGVIRNQQMVDAKPDFCVAFPGGRGTADMVKRCYNAGITVWSFGS